MKATCKKCSKEFEPYTTIEDCQSCHDGDYETDMDRYDGGTDIITCPFCKGSGCHNIEHKTYCESCTMEMEYYDED